MSNELELASAHLSYDIFLRRERDWVLGEFKAGRSPILIATDVASRGIGMHCFPSLLQCSVSMVAFAGGCANRSS